MNPLLREIILVFVIIVFSNVIVDIRKEQKAYLVNPIRFFSSAIILSVIGGYVINWIHRNSKVKED